MGTTLSLVYRDCKAPYLEDDFRQSNGLWMTEYDIYAQATKRTAAIRRRWTHLRVGICIIWFGLICHLSIDAMQTTHFKAFFIQTAICGVAWILLNELEQYEKYKVIHWRNSALEFVKTRKLTQKETQEKNKAMLQECREIFKQVVADHYAQHEDTYPADDHEKKPILRKTMTI